MTSDTPNDWNEVGPGTPLNIWLETKLEGEEGTSLSFCRILSIGDDPEWIAPDGRTTVTHSTYAPPSHWKWPKEMIADRNQACHLMAGRGCLYAIAVRETGILK